MPPSFLQVHHIDKPLLTENFCPVQVKKYLFPRALSSACNCTLLRSSHKSNILLLIFFYKDIIEKTFDRPNDMQI